MLTAAAYGFRIANDPGHGWLAVEGAERWPLLTLARNPEVTPEQEAHVDGSLLRVDICVAVAEDEVAHPLLGRALSLLAPARGIDAMHGGVLCGAGGAWAVTGPKESGKSTLLAHCAREGALVMSDDVVALDGLACLAGPRCIDLREASARRLGPGTPVRGGARQRITLPPAPAAVELAGIVYLAWGAECELVRLRPSERLARLAARRAEERWPRDPELLLDLAARPAFELRRPHGLASLELSADMLTGAIGMSAQAA